MALYPAMTHLVNFTSLDQVVFRWGNVLLYVDVDIVVFSF